MEGSEIGANGGETRNYSQQEIQRINCLPKLAPKPALLPKPFLIPGLSILLQQTPMPAPPEAPIVINNEEQVVEKRIPKRRNTITLQKKLEIILYKEANPKISWRELGAKFDLGTSSLGSAICTVSASLNFKW